MKNFILSIIAISMLSFMSCKKGDEPTPQSTTSPTTVVTPVYYYTITYKGVTYQVNNGIDLYGQQIENGISTQNKIVGCPDFTKIAFQFVRAYNPTTNNSPSVFAGGTSSDLTNFVGVIPQINNGNANDNTNFPYKCTILFTDNNNNYVRTKDINYDMSTYFINIYEVGYDYTEPSTTHVYNYIKGNFNVLLENGEVISGNFYVPYHGTI